MMDNNDRLLHGAASIGVFLGLNERIVRRAAKYGDMPLYSGAEEHFAPDLPTSALGSIGRLKKALE